MISLKSVCIQLSPWSQELHRNSKGGHYLDFKRKDIGQSWKKMSFVALSGLFSVMYEQWSLKSKIRKWIHYLCQIQFWISHTWTSILKPLSLNLSWFDDLHSDFENVDACTICTSVCYQCNIRSMSGSFLSECQI